MTYAGRIALAAALVALASGCAEPGHVDPANRAVSPAPSPSTAASRLRPPENPTDLTKPTPWIVGTITAGGTGPCYGLVTDEGVNYALHSTAGLRLDKGTRVRVRTTPARVRINCGPGKLLELTAAEPQRAG